MSGRPFSVILLPTLDCNVACDYCFERKHAVRLALDDLPRLAGPLLDHMVARGSPEASIYWQGGEVMLLGPSWFERAHAILGEASAARQVTLHHLVQTNLIGWSHRWHDITRTMFGNSIGTSMDFPNRHRKLRNGSSEQYTRVWLQALGDVQAQDIAVGCIAVLQPETLDAGAEAFYAFFTETARLVDFQVNLPFPGGPGQGAAPLQSDRVARFMTDLMDIWMARGFEQGVRVGPFDALLDTFSGRPTTLPCIWQPNCAADFISVDARGVVALCDCWVTSYPEHHFGNILERSDLTALLEESPARRRFLARPEEIMRAEDCMTCPWLSMCHGGCPVRTFTARGTLEAKDPYCEVYKTLFAHAREVAKTAARRRIAATG